jgi:hypothetical protein
MFMGSAFGKELDVPACSRELLFDYFFFPLFEEDGSRFAYVLELVLTTEVMFPLIKRHCVLSLVRCAPACK